jgi:antitoxin component of MazEF toxin-antitoxin module
LRSHEEALIVPNETTIRPMGNAVGVTIPQGMLKRYGLATGDRVHLQETDKGILITPSDVDSVDAMEVYREGANNFRNAMRELGGRIHGQEAPHDHP